MTYKQIISLPHVAEHRIVLGLLQLTAEEGYQLTKYTAEDARSGRFYASHIAVLPLSKKYPDTFRAIADEQAAIYQAQKETAKKRITNNKTN
ncbi:MAG: hypothetical protein ACI30A_06685 [Paludibacteraceae bacterium]